MELIGILLPAGIDFINRNVKSSDARFWVSILVCALVGTLVNWLQTLWVFSSPVEAFNSVTTSILAMVGIAQITYKGFYEGSGMQKSIDSRIELNLR